ncbi:solute carrier family 22 member 3-like [Epargyreus clarus]|uniref:solute carrier family 22 member 3-like n=1 Tax=Epargyreus clarus TaxID=520877 RepID=UPI003C2CE29E
MKCEVIRRISQGTIEKEINELANIQRERQQAKAIKNQAGKEEEDYLEKTIGAFGIWQAFISVTVVLGRAVSMWNMMSIVFLTPLTEFNCVEFSYNAPLEPKNSTCYENCLRYEYSSVVEKNIIEEFKMICQDAWLASFIQFILMLGVLLGVSLFGWISDRFGRRVGLLLSMFINAVFMISMSFSPNVTVFCIIRFIIGVATGGSLLICIVHVLEITGKKYREIAGALCVLPDCIAEASLAGFAYFTSDWRNYTLSYGVATCIIFILMVFVPESPRWLVSNEKVDEAVKVITSAATRNNLDTTNIKEDITKVIEDMNLLNQGVVKTTYLDFFKSKKIFVLTLTVCVMWLGLGMCFYGIYQYDTIIGMNPFLTIIILGLIQIPLCPLEIVLNKRFGRKISIIGASCGVGVTMVILVFIPEGHWVAKLLGIIGFSCATIIFAVAYVQVSELFPTPLRNKGYGMAASGARVGAMVAPFVANLMPRWLPSVCFAVMAFVTGFCCLFLPETKGQNLKDTIEK